MKQARESTPGLKTNPTSELQFSGSEPFQLFKQIKNCELCGTSVKRGQKCLGASRRKFGKVPHILASRQRPPPLYFLIDLFPTTERRFQGGPSHQPYSDTGGGALASTVLPHRRGISRINLRLLRRHSPRHFSTSTCGHAPALSTSFHYFCGACTPHRESSIWYGKRAAAVAAAGTGGDLVRHQQQDHNSP